MINRREAILSLAGLMVGGDRPEAAEYDSRAAVAAANIAATEVEVRTRGYAVTGDGGAAVYKRVTHEPLHPGKVQSGDGAWWEVGPQTLTPQMFGASPTNAAEVNTNGFKAMAAVIEVWGGGRIVIDGGEFTVFSETINPSPSADAPYYRGSGGLINLKRCVGVEIHFINGARLKAASGLHYGSFDPLTGEAYEHGRRFTGKNHAATMGNFINIVRCSNVHITNAKIHGNNSDYALGGRWGDTGIQLQASGIRISQSIGVTIGSFDIQYCGLDGIYIGGAVNQQINLRINKGVSRYNGRQGCSWTGGWGVTVEDCDFTKTGYGTVSSAPRAGLDIEHNKQGLGDGRFIRCRFYDNAGASLLNPQRMLNGSVVFEECTFQNGSGKRAIWYNDHESGAVFNDCKIYGNITNVQFCRFNRCYLTNGPWEDGVTGSPLFIDVNSPAKFDSCKIECFDNSTYNFTIRGGAEARRCAFVFSQPVAVARCRIGILGCLIDDCTFTQNFGDASAAEPKGERCFIERNARGFSAQGENTITGTAITWDSRTGPQGLIRRRVNDPA